VDEPRDNPPPKEPSKDAAALEREIRAGREFSLAEAIGRLGGKDLMKGASPVSRRRQADLEIRGLLRSRLDDADGALRTILRRRVVESDTLLAGRFEDPRGALRAYVERALASDGLLRSLVRDADAEWGRDNDTRPHFDRAGRDPHPDDPYTVESVRAALTRLLHGLPAD
jgi:hypothetical protein